MHARAPGWFYHPAQDRRRNPLHSGLWRGKPPFLFVLDTPECASSNVLKLSFEMKPLPPAHSMAGTYEACVSWDSNDSREGGRAITNPASRNVAAAEKRQ